MDTLIHIINEYFAVLPSNRHVPYNDKFYILNTLFWLSYLWAIPTQFHINTKWIKFDFSRETKKIAITFHVNSHQFVYSLATILTSKTVIFIHWWQENHKIALSSVPRYNSFTKARTQSLSYIDTFIHISYNNHIAHNESQ